MGKSDGMRYGTSQRYGWWRGVRTLMTAEMLVISHFSERRGGGDVEPRLSGGTRMIRGLVYL